MKKSELKELYQMMFPEYPDIVTVRQLREMLGISRQLAYDLINDGELQAIKIGTSLKIPKASVIHYVTGEQKEVKFLPQRVELTPSQRRRCNRLIKKLCANYDDGNCLPLDEGDGCVCVQMISLSLICKYFRNAVLPADKELYADIFRQRTYHCVECGAAFVPNSNRQKYCPACSKKVHRRQKNEGSPKSFSRFFDTFPL